MNYATDSNCQLHGLNLRYGFISGFIFINVYGFSNDTVLGGGQGSKLKICELK